MHQRTGITELAWHRQLRELRQPVTPQRDLWAAIDGAVEQDAPWPASTASKPVQRRWARGRSWTWLAAASIALSLLLTGALGWHLRHASAAAPIAEVLPSAADWKPADPRLAGAAIELGAARRELQQALQQAPDSPALQRLLLRTEQQQTQLRQWGREAG